MIAIRMSFLSGRLHSTPWGHHVNEGVVEYPPSHFRLLRSLIAVKRRACRDTVTEEQLRNIVSALRTPPVFKLPAGTIAHTRHYDQQKKVLKFLDTFVQFGQDNEILWGWPESHLDQPDREALSVLLSALGTFGRAESWCEAELLSPEESHPLAENGNWINCRPLGEVQGLPDLKTTRLLIANPALAGEDLVKVLEISTTTMRKAKQVVPPGTLWINYVLQDGILDHPALTIRRRTIPTKTYSVARFALSSNVLPRVTDALPFSEQVRRALIRNRVDTSHSEVILGKKIDGEPLVGHLHAHYLPTDEDRDGRLDHITIFAPLGFDKWDLDAIGAMKTIFRRGSQADVKLILTGLGTVDQIAELTPFHSSRKWRSVTPFSLARFANRGAGKVPRPKDLPEAQLSRELTTRGLPVPQSIRRIDGYTPTGASLIRWLEFHHTRFNGKEGHGLAGFELEFDQPVKGPISLGFACHFGLGLFLPID
jgi:CRISPR-associated protein Csb2